MPHGWEADASRCRNFGRDSVTGPAVVFAVTGPYPLRIPAGRPRFTPPGRTGPVQELGDLGLQRVLQQQLRPQPGDRLGRAGQILRVVGYPVEVVTQPLRRRHSNGAPGPLSVVRRR